MSSTEKQIGRARERVRRARQREIKRARGREREPGRSGSHCGRGARFQAGLGMAYQPSHILHQRPRPWKPPNTETQNPPGPLALNPSPDPKPDGKTKTNP